MDNEKFLITGATTVLLGLCFDTVPVYQANTSPEIDARLIGEAIEHWKNQPHFQIHMGGRSGDGPKNLTERRFLSWREELRRACEKVRLKFPLFGCIWFWWEMEPDGVNLRVRMAAKDRDTGVVREFRSDALFTHEVLMPAPGAPWDEEEVVSTLAQCARGHILQHLLEHETDEMLLVNGKRVDPHEDD